MALDKRPVGSNPTASANDPLPILGGGSFFSYFFCHRAFAAAFAISARLSAFVEAARALPPLLPSSAAALRGLSSTSPLAILTTSKARRFRSAGRFSPFGPLAMSHHSRPEVSRVEAAQELDFKLRHYPEIFWNFYWKTGSESRLFRPHRADCIRCRSMA